MMIYIQYWLHKYFSFVFLLITYEVDDIQSMKITLVLSITYF